MLPAMLAAALAFSPADARLALDTASALVERHTPRDAGTVRSARAARFILDAASAAGLDARLDEFRADSPSGIRRFCNVEAEYVSDRSSPWIVFVSHYDTKPGTGCPGANDGASTSGLLVALGGALVSARPSGVNVLFVWTDAEECMESYSERDGFQGSKRAAARLAESGRSVSAVVCLDMLGDGDLHMTIPRNGSARLARHAAALAHEAGIELSLSRDLVKDDHVAFLEAGFDAIDIIDFEYGPEPGSNAYWHTLEDTMDKVSAESLLAAGRLAAALATGNTDKEERK